MTNQYVKELITTVYSGALTVNGSGSIITIKVVDRIKVKKDLYAYLDKFKYKYLDVKETRSSFNVTKIKTPDNKEVTIVYKDAKGGGGSGAGAKITNLGESAQCWYTAIAFNNSKLESLDDFLKLNKTVSSKCDTTASIKDIIEKLPEEWVESSIKIANYMKKMAEFRGNLTKYEFHRGSTLVDKINTMFASANKKDNYFANINKWSPADIWLVTAKGKSIIQNAPTDQTFASLNLLISELYTSHQAIGVSLKKLGATAHHEVFNLDRKPSNAKFKSFTVSPKSKDGYILFSYKDDPNMSIQTRSFSDTGGWQGEIKGKYAAGGKIGGGGIAKIFANEGAKLSSGNANAIAQRIQNKDQAIDSAILKFAKMLGVTVNSPVGQTNDWKYSKFLTLETFATFKELNNAKQEAILREIVGYASSASELSAVFIKIS